MGYIKCPVCELNYIQDTETMCDTCKADKKIGINVKYLDPPVRKNGRGIFYVFQNKTFQEEFVKGYISAPVKDEGGNCPHHWLRLENIKPNDIILHGVGGCIAAVSLATTPAQRFIAEDGREWMKVECDYKILNHVVYTDKFKKEKIKFCANKQYQPFDKNGGGNQGYLFDLDWNMATVFLKEIIDKNPRLKDEQFVKDVL